MWQDHTKCKSFFPRDAWLTSEAILICSGLAGAKGMPRKSKRSMVGMPWGPCNDPNLNGNHPALLAALRCNGDVQLPFRFPITPITRNTSCDQQCDQKMPIWTLVREAQINQSAQARCSFCCEHLVLRAATPCRVIQKSYIGLPQRNLVQRLGTNAIMPTSASRLLREKSRNG